MKLQLKRTELLIEKRAQANRSWKQGILNKNCSINMRKILFSIVATATMLIPNLSAQERATKVSSCFVTSFSGRDSQILTGFDFGLSKDLSKRFGISVNIEFGRHNNLPKFMNGGSIGATTTLPELDNYILENVRDVGGLWQKTNQQIYSLSGYYSFIKTKKHSANLNLGAGYNVQDSFDFGISYAKILIYEDGSTKLDKYETYFSQRNSTTLVLLSGIGYDYQINDKLEIGINIRGQLPLKQEDYFFKVGGAGFDEILRFGLKLTRKL